MIIGITGISGAGKSMVSKEICKLKNARNINADQIAKEMTKKRERVLFRSYKDIWSRNFRRKPGR